MDRVDAAIGCLLGTAVADALGLPSEGLSRRRQQRWFPAIDRQRLVFGHGMCSDDTDHACMLAQAIVASGAQPRRFVQSFAWRLRFWFLGLPAGVGFATLRSILKLWLFIPPQVSGVHSAGNGPAMRSAILGVCFADSDPLLVMHNSAATTITHRDPKAEIGALAIALAARSALRGEDAEAYLAHLRRFAATFGDAGGELVGLAERALASARSGEATATYAAAIGCENGVSGYMYHSVPAVLHAWFAHPEDYAAAVSAVIRCGGDTDTTAAMVGGIVGARVGKAGIPAHWLGAIWDWPRGTAWIEELARRAVRAADTRTPQGTLFIAPWWLLARNFIFLLVVLAHGFRRLGPPY
ncbi:MAG: ADP-ribosylglycohydrolase family protein [Burkholderiales bacterium]